MSTTTPLAEPVLCPNNERRLTNVHSPCGRETVSPAHLGQKDMAMVRSTNERREAEPGQPVGGSHEFAQDATHVFAGLVQIHGFAIAIQLLGTHDEQFGIGDPLRRLFGIQGHDLF